MVSQVLQHHRPERIDEVMRELLRVGERVIIIASWGRDAQRSRRTHAYHHDYVAISGAWDVR